MNGFKQYFPSIYVTHSKGVGGSCPVQHGKDSWYVLPPHELGFPALC